MRSIDEFSGLDGMNAGLTQQWLLTADCSTPRRQRQEMLGSPSDDLLVGGTTSAGKLDDLRRYLGSIRATCWNWLNRYGGARLWWHLNARTHTIPGFVASVGLSTQCNVICLHNMTEKTCCCADDGLESVQEICRKADQQQVTVLELSQHKIGDERHNSMTRQWPLDTPQLAQDAETASTGKTQHLTLI